MRRSLIALLVPCLSLPLSASESTGTKMTVRTSAGSYRDERISYWQSDRKRIEYRTSFGYRVGPHLASITRCDSGQDFELNLDSSQYESGPYPPALMKAQMLGLDQPKVSSSAKPTMRIEIKTVDTGERKQLFGRAARHVVTTAKQTQLGASESQLYETVRDGWYVDLSQTISCDPAYMRQTRAAYVTYALVVGGQKTGSQTIDKPEIVNVGKPENGLALQEVITHRPAGGTTKHANSEFKIVVTNLQEGPLNPALFEVPHGFKQVKQIARNPPVTSNPVVEIWEWTKYTVANWFGLE